LGRFGVLQERDEAFGRSGQRTQAAEERGHDGVVPCPKPGRHAIPARSIAIQRARQGAAGIGKRSRGRPWLPQHVEQRIALPNACEVSCRARPWKWSTATVTRAATPRLREFATKSLGPPRRCSGIQRLRLY
jgi:hypothetical protein